MRILENPVVLVALIVLVIVLFGAKRLPDVAKSVGSSLKIFKKEVRDLREDDKDAPVTSAPAATTPPPAAPTTPVAPTPPPVQDPQPRTGDGAAPRSTDSTPS